jgi:hypothetical protein
MPKETSKKSDSCIKFHDCHNWTEVGETQKDRGGVSSIPWRARNAVEDYLHPHPYGETKNLGYIYPVPLWGVVRLGLETIYCSAATLTDDYLLQHNGSNFRITANKVRHYLKPYKGNLPR